MSSTSNEEYVDRGAGDLDRLERLWAPYRMNYIVDKSDTNGSGNTHTNPFVVIPTLSDEDGLIVARGTYVYCVLNLFPYNSGHMMVVPYREEPNLENLTPAESAELMAFAQAAIRVLKTASRPDAAARGVSAGPVPTRLSQFSAKARMSRRWLGVSVTCPIVVSPASSRPVEETSYMVSGTVRSIS